MNSSLRGKRITVTRPQDQSATMFQMLQARGAMVIPFPTIRIESPTDSRPLAQALRELDTFQRVIFTSVNGVAYTWKYLQRSWPDSVRVAAIGPATATALRMRGVTPDFVPSKYIAEALAEGLTSVQDQKILLPRASRSRPALARLLRAAGANVTAVTAYETHMNHPGDTAYAALAHGTDIVTFTSGSTVEGFAAVAPDSRLPVTAACIGPITTRVATKVGFKVAVVAKIYTTKGLVTALEEYFEQLQQA